MKWFFKEVIMNFNENNQRGELKRLGTRCGGASNPSSSDYFLE